MQSQVENKQPVSTQRATVSNVDIRHLGDKFSSQMESLGLQAGIKAERMVAAKICA